MLLELHDQPLAGRIKVGGLLYGDFLTTQYEPTHYFVTLNELVIQDEFASAVVSATHDPRVSEHSVGFSGMKGVGPLEACDVVLGLAWAPETILLGNKLATSLGKKFGFVEYARPRYAAARFRADDVRCCRLKADERVVVIDDVCVTGDGLAQACGVVRDYGATPYGLVVVARGSAETIQGPMAGNDVLVLVSPEDIGTPTGPTYVPLDIAKIEAQRGGPRAPAARQPPSS
ncbi:MAG: hypothetical protein WBG19_05275 [Thermoplasmata archaeon]